MDINKLKKMNDMAVELRKHNIATDSGEACSLAEDLYNKPGEEKFINTQKGVEEKMMTNTINTSEMEDLKKQLKNLSYANKDSNEKIAMLIEKMNEMISEIKRIDGKVINMRADIKSVPSSPAVTSEPQKKIETAKEEPKKSEGLVPGDVSIEKYFYCGNK